MTSTKTPKERAQVPRQMEPVPKLVKSVPNNDFYGIHLQKVEATINRNISTSGPMEKVVAVPEQNIFISELKQHGLPDALSKEFSFKCLSVMIYSSLLFPLSS